MSNPPSLSFNFELHPRQMEAFNSPATEKLYGGAAGGGKSHLIRIFAIVSCLRVPGLQAYIFRRQATDLIKNHIEGPSGFPILLAPLMKGDTPFVKITYSPNVEISFRNGPFGGFEGGSKIFLCHCKDENNKYNYQGAEIHLLLIDELTHFTETIYTFLRSRVRIGGLIVPEAYKGIYPCILCGSNPGGVGHGWVKVFFIEGIEPMEIRQMPDEEGGLLRQYIPARLSDNPTLLANDPKYAARLKGLGNEALVKAMLDGDWDVFVGQAFNFSARHHVIKPRIVPAGATIYMVMDWGYGAPFAIAWCWADGEGRVYQCGEWYGWNGKPNEGVRMTDTQIALGVIEREIRMGLAGRDIQRLSGPDCFSKKPDYKGGGQGPSTAEMFARQGLFLRPGDPDKAAKLRQFYERLRVRDDGPPMFQVYDTCKQTIRTIPTLTMRESDPEVLEDTGAEDHFYDAICHVFMARPMGPYEQEAPKSKEARFIEMLEQTPDTDAAEVEGFYGEEERQTVLDIFGGNSDGDVGYPPGVGGDTWPSGWMQ